MIILQLQKEKDNICYPMSFDISIYGDGGGGYYTGNLTAYTREYITVITDMLYRLETGYISDWGVLRGITIAGNIRECHENRLIKIRGMEYSCLAEREYDRIDYQLIENNNIHARRYSLKIFTLEDQQSHIVLKAMDYFTFNDEVRLYNTDIIKLSGTDIEFSEFFGNFFNIKDDSVYRNRKNELRFSYIDHLKTEHHFSARKYKDRCRPLEYTNRGIVLRELFFRKPTMLRIKRIRNVIKDIITNESNLEKEVKDVGLSCYSGISEESKAYPEVLRT